MDLIKDMSMEVQLRLCRLLDVDQGGIVKDARHLAQEIGIDNATIQVLWNGRGDGAEKPTAIILRKMETLYGTVDNLQNLLSKIKRLDCVELLQEAYPHLASPPDKAEMPGTLVKATTGAVLTTKDATLQIGAGSLPEDAKITMEQCDKYSAFQDIVDKGLLHCFPVVLKFTPRGLTFWNKAADLTVRFENADAGLKVFVLHGHYDTEDRRVVWKLDNKNVKREGEFAHIVMKSFCYRVVCQAVDPDFFHILSIINHEINCYATALYRELSPSKLQVAVVLWTEFVEEPPKQLKRLTSETNRYRYTIAEEGTQKLVCTQHPLKVNLELPGANQLSSKEIEISIDQLDKAGMVIDNLPEIEAQRAIIHIFGCYPNDQLQHFWTLRIGEITRTTSTSGNSNHDYTDVASVTSPEDNPGPSDTSDDQEDGAVGFFIQSELADTNSNATTPTSKNYNMHLVKDMSMEVRRDLCNLLDVDQGSTVKDARNLAQEIGIDNATIKILWEGRGEGGGQKPTEEILNKLATLNKTIADILKLLSKIERFDCTKILHEAYIQT